MDSENGSGLVSKSSFIFSQYFYYNVHIMERFEERFTCYAAYEVLREYFVIYCCLYGVLNMF